MSLGSTRQDVPRADLEDRIERLEQLVRHLQRARPAPKQPIPAPASGNIVTLPLASFAGNRHELSVQRYNETLGQWEIANYTNTGGALNAGGADGATALVVRSETGDLTTVDLAFPGPLPEATIAIHGLTAEAYWWDPETEALVAGYERASVLTRTSIGWEVHAYQTAQTEIALGDSEDLPESYLRFFVAGRDASGISTYRLPENYLLVPVTGLGAVQGKLLTLTEASGVLVATLAVAGDIRDGIAQRIGYVVAHETDQDQAVVLLHGHAPDSLPGAAFTGVVYLSSVAGQMRSRDFPGGAEDDAIDGEAVGYRHTASILLGTRLYFFGWPSEDARLGMGLDRLAMRNDADIPSDTMLLTSAELSFRGYEDAPKLLLETNPSRLRMWYGADEDPRVDLHAFTAATEPVALRHINVIGTDAKYRSVLALASDPAEATPGDDFRLPFAQLQYTIQTSTDTTSIPGTSEYLSVGPASPAPNGGFRHVLFARGNYNAKWLMQKEIDSTAPSADKQCLYYDILTSKLKWGAGNAAQFQGRNVSTVAPSNGHSLVWDGSNWSPRLANANSIHSRAIASSAPSTNDVLLWSGSTWEPGVASAGEIQGRDVLATAPTTGQNLAWNGSAWAPAAVNAVQLQGRSISAAAPTTGHVLTWNGTTWLAAAINALKIQGVDVDASTPVDGQVLMYNLTHSKWIPSTPRILGVAAPKPAGFLTGGELVFYNNATATWISSKSEFAPSKQINIYAENFAFLYLDTNSGASSASSVVRASVGDYYFRSEIGADKTAAWLSIRKHTTGTTIVASTGDLPDGKQVKFREVEYKDHSGTNRTGWFLCAL